MFDAVSYVMGMTKGIGKTIITGDMIFADDGEGNISVVTETEGDD